MRDLTPREAEYLRLLYEESVEKTVRVTSVSMARRLHVKPPTVVDMVAHLAGKGLVNHIKRQEIILTRKGLEIASTLVRQHRIYEKYLTSIFQLPPEEACREAAKVDHVLSSKIVEAMYVKLGCPDSCPHDKTIPAIAQNLLPKGERGEKEIGVE